MKTREEQVVILCGGEGTRLREETEFKPKALVEIGGRPILWHLMRIYDHYGFRKFVLCLGYRGDLIREYFLDYRWRDFDFQLDLRSGERKLLARQQDAIEDWEIVFAETGERTQTGARLKAVERYVTGETFLCNYTDGLSDVNLKELVDFHHRCGKTATLTGFHPRSRFGVVRAADDGTVEYFQEKPILAEQTSGGFFVMNRGVFGYLSTDPGCILETQPMEAMASDRELALYSHEGFWYSMDTYKEALALNRMWEEGRAPWRTWE
ncbi:MAG TPA: glucose-1-phosphate cytidylyltransferase [Planctomycetes bacterium]|nr:glucose-1-phosphate cytidylyltransferase [Planctomycetota bacterium]